MRKLQLHWKIIIGLVLGILWGFIAINTGLVDLTLDWIAPIGNIFVKLLKLIAIPLIIASLIMGMANLRDFSRLSSLGLKTVSIYLVTTVIAVTIGLLAVNITNPGSSIPQDLKDELVEKYGQDVEQRKEAASQVQGGGPLKALEDIIPDNIFNSVQDNGNMLQVVFFAIFFGICLIAIPEEKGRVVYQFFDGLNDVVLKMVDFIMIIAPYGVFALIAKLIVETEGSIDLLKAELVYALTVVVGLGFMIFIVYPLALRLFTKMKISKFFRGMMPAQLLAFSTSSSAATLPVTMERCEKHLGIKEEVTSFVLPVGATINMDGTSLYQAVAAVFIAQVYGHDLTLGDQLTIVLTATLASIGSAAVPGAGMVMLVIVLQSIGIDPQGLVLIVAPDRILDMCRTMVNVTGDAAVATIVASTEGKIGTPANTNSDILLPQPAEL